MRSLFIAIALFLGASSAWAESPIGRQQQFLSDGWRFRFGAEPTGVISAGFDDSAWSVVSVPHTWNRVGNYGAARSQTTDIDRGVGWYRLHFRAPGLAEGRHAFLQFDAASIVAEVWLNGRRLGSHAGAFSRFRLDATDALHPGGDNVLAVKVDNSKPDPGSPTQDVVPISGDFFMYGGLYRPVSLLVVGRTHIDMLDEGSPGVYARTDRLTDDRAEVSVRTMLAGDAEPVLVATRVLDAKGATVAQVSQRASGRGDSIAVLAIRHPHRWDGQHDPYFYHVVVEVRAASGALLDRVEQPLGLRSVVIDPDRGFILNGRHIQLHGVTRHQDREGRGWALTPADEQEDMALIREIGANTIRLSHYNQSQGFADLADRDGMILWAELGVVNLTAPPGVRDTPPPMLASARQQLIELIRQNYNHPSIALWSIGNEVTNWSSKRLTPGNARPLMEALQTVAKREDPTRPTTIGVCCEPLPGEPDMGQDRTSGTADTVGYNLYLGWYGSGHAEEASRLRSVLMGLHAEHPHIPISLSEYGAGGAVSQHSDDPFGGKIESIARPQPEEVQAAVHELSWKAIEDIPFLWGSYAWEMFDSTSDLREEGDSVDLNTKGLVSFDRKRRKQAFYFYKAAWRTDPVLHLIGGDYIDRPYAVVDVRAYSNAAEARLTLDGHDLGTVRCADAVCVWPKVRLHPGANRIEASARWPGGRALSDAMTWRFGGAERVVHIRAGSLTSVTTSDGTVYGSDVYFVGGEGHTLNPIHHELYASGKKSAPPIRVDGAAQSALYVGYRAGRHFSYHVPLPDGGYRVTLHGFEPDRAAVARRFSVTVSGGARRDGVDYATLAGGPLRATDLSLQARVTGGELVIDFDGANDEALVSAIDIVPAP